MGIEDEGSRAFALIEQIKQIRRDAREKVGPDRSLEQQSLMVELAGIVGQEQMFEILRDIGKEVYPEDYQENA